MKLAFGLVAASTFAVLFAACDAETIVLATVVEDDAGTNTANSVACQHTSDCPDPDTQYCKVVHPPFGSCRDRPRFCNADDPPHPTCGITGISYYNDCYRNIAGDDEASDGDCDDTAIRCTDDGTKLCPQGAVCDLLGGGNPGSICGSKFGKCWGIVTCPPNSDDKIRWEECSTGTDALKCVDTCTAIQTGRPFTREFDCGANGLPGGQQ